METRRRSLVKALSWRVLALAITSGVTYAFSASVSLAVSIGLLDSAIKIGAYYAHERAWMRSSFGMDSGPVRVDAGLPGGALTHSNAVAQ